MRGFIDGEYQDGELRGLTFLAGMRGMGKTTEMARLLGQCAGGVLIFDTTGNHASLLRGYKTLSQPGGLKDYLRANRARRFRVRYVPALSFGDMEEAQIQHFRAVCSIAQAYGSMIFAVDEVDTFCGPRWGVKNMPVELYNLAHFGRHCKVSMLVTARDPSSLSIRFRSQCETFRIFRVDEERYVQYFAGRIGKANAARLSSLPRFEYLLWRSGDSNVTVAGGRRTL